MKMDQSLKIAISIDDYTLAESIVSQLQSTSDIDITRWNGKLHTDQLHPQIIIVGDNGSDGEGISQKVSRLSKTFSQSAIFVVSKDTRPENIIDVMKAGGAEYLLAPVDRKILLNAVEEVRDKHAEAAMTQAGKGRQGTVYSFISAKGGLGSSVLAVNTAVAMAVNDMGRVALQDIGFQSGDSSVYLDIVPETSIVDLCRNFNRLDISLLHGAMSKHNTGVELLAAPLDQVDSEEISPEHIIKILDLLPRAYDKVIVDCTSMYIDECSIEAFNAADKVFVVTDLSVPALRNAARLSQLVRKLGIGVEKVEFVVNRYSKSGSFQIKEAERTLGKRFFWLFPNQFDDIVSSVNEGVPVVQSYPRSGFSKSIKEFVQKLLDPEKYREYRGIRSVFRRAI
jgi:pilus assembly protein CpaE